MIDNLEIIAAIIALLWLASLGLYLYASRQHNELQKNIEALGQSLDNDLSDEQG